jgi:hypothetical protein
MTDWQEGLPARKERTSEGFRGRDCQATELAGRGGRVCEGTGRRPRRNMYIHRDPGPQAHSGARPKVRWRHKIAAHVPGWRPLLADPAGVSAFQHNRPALQHQPSCRPITPTMRMRPSLEGRPSCDQPA